MENPRLHIILHNPKIPQNTGNIGRMCSVIGARLHLIHPLGFVITDAKLRRSGMDYWKTLDVVHHENWEAFLLSPKAPPLERIWLFTTKAEKFMWGVPFKLGDGLMFGAEDCGVPDYVHEALKERSLRIPQFEKNVRCLNLSTSAGIGAYEAMRVICAANPAGFEMF